MLGSCGLKSRITQLPRITHHQLWIRDLGWIVNSFAAHGKKETAAKELRLSHSPTIPFLSLLSSRRNIINRPLVIRLMNGDGLDERRERGWLVMWLVIGSPLRYLVANEIWPATK